MYLFLLQLLTNPLLNITLSVFFSLNSAKKDMEGGIG